MKERRTSESKLKMLMIRLTEEEHKALKLLSVDRGISLTRFVLECVRTYIKEKT